MMMVHIKQAASIAALLGTVAVIIGIGRFSRDEGYAGASAGVHSRLIYEEPDRSNSRQLTLAEATRMMDQYRVLYLKQSQRVVHLQAEVKHLKVLLHKD